MFYVRPTVVFSCLVLALAFLPDGLAYGAKNTSTEKRNSNWHQVPKNKAKASYSVTCGSHQITGWHKGITKRDPNLPHWQWLAMQEADKKYVHVAPGADPRQFKTKVTHYPKPIHVAPGQGPKKYLPTTVGTSAPSSHYVKPVHAALPNIDTAIKMRAARQDLEPKLVVPQTDAALVGTNTNIKLSVPSTNIKLAAPQTAVKLVAPSTNAKLRQEKTDAKLLSTKTVGKLSLSEETDAFDSGVPSVSPYGLARHQGSNHDAAANTRVRGKLVRKHH